MTDQPEKTIKFINKAKLAVWVQDLWPEDLVTTGHVKDTNTTVLKINEWAARLLYFFTDQILIQSVLSITQDISTLFNLLSFGRVHLKYINDLLL